jgi:hypothetical protein
MQVAWTLMYQTSKGGTSHTHIKQHCLIIHVYHIQYFRTPKILQVGKLQIN